MTDTAPVIVHHRGIDRTGWQRFVAVLCFIEFYARFVSAGQSLWHQRFGYAPMPRSDLWPEVAGLALAAASYGLGRSLWFDRRSQFRWFGVVLALWLIAAGMWYYLALVDAQRFPVTSWNPVLVALRWTLPEFVPFFPLLGAGWYLWRSRESVSGGPAPWVAIAIIWCLGRLALLPTVDSPVTAYQEALLYVRFSGNAAVAFLVPIIYGGIVCLAAVLLFACWRRLARLLVFALASVEAVPPVMDAFVYAWLCHAGMEMLMMSSPARPDNPIPWPWTLFNSQMFQVVAVDLVRQIGPWLLIAWYIRSKPMRTAPDDGSPWPRRYCGGCGYNLHGLDGSRCPECGAGLFS